MCIGGNGMDDKLQRELMIAWHQFMEHDDELYYDNQPSLHFQSGFEAAVALLKINIDIQDKQDKPLQVLS